MNYYEPEVNRADLGLVWLPAGYRVRREKKFFSIHNFFV